MPFKYYLIMHYHWAIGTSMQLTSKSLPRWWGILTEQHCLGCERSTSPELAQFTLQAQISSRSSSLISSDRSYLAFNIQTASYPLRKWYLISVRQAHQFVIPHVLPIQCPILVDNLGRQYKLNVLGLNAVTILPSQPQALIMCPESFNSLSPQFQSFIPHFLALPVTLPLPTLFSIPESGW